MTSNHISEEMLETYVLGRLPAQQMGFDNDPELVIIEEHILGCPECAEAALGLQSFAAAIRKVCNRQTRPRRVAKPKVMAAGSPLPY